MRHGARVGSDREQKLARTATAAAGEPAEPAEPVGATLGRYRLERELDATLPPGADVTGSAPSTPLAGLTVTGSLLGTRRT